MGSTSRGDGRKLTENSGNSENPGSVYVQENIRLFDPEVRLDSLAKDIRYALRQLRSSPALTAVAVLSIALGIGLNAAMFSAVNALLLRPAPVKSPSELVALFSSHPDGIDYSTISWPDYRDLVSNNDVFSGVTAHTHMLASVTMGADGGDARLIVGELVTASYFDVLGVVPPLGRGFSPGEDEYPSRVAVLSHAFWERELASRPGAVGETLRINGETYTIVGVAPRRFKGLVPALVPELWIPAVMADEVEPMGMQDMEGEPTPESRLEHRGRRFLFGKARLLPGRSVDEARAQMDTLASRLAAEYPDTNEERGITVVPASTVRFHPMIDRMLSPAAVVLMVLVGLVLVIACANVANLLLARASVRGKEMALRSALGAGRSQLVRQLVCESLVLSLLGGAIGLGLALVVARFAGSIPVVEPIRIDLDFGLDWRVFGFASLLSILTGLGFGALPALHSTRSDLVSSLRAVAGAEARGQGRMTFKNLLVVAQVSLSLVLLVGASLLFRSLSVARAADLGFPVERLAMVTMHVEMNGYEEEGGKAFFREILDRVRSMPEIEDAAFTARPPMTMNISLGNIYPEGLASADDAEGYDVDVTFVGTDYFRTLGVAIQEGRPIGDRDVEGAPRVAVVNEALAERAWPGESALGKRFRRRLDGDLYTVVGVSRNHKVRTVGEPERPYVHFSVPQHYNPFSILMFRSRTDPRVALENVRRELRTLDEDFVPFETETMTDVVATTLLPVRIGTSLLGAFSLLGVLLAAIGLYGLMAFWVSRRVREVGIRIALGAEQSSILGMVIGQGMRLVAAGAVVGLVLSALGGSALSSVLYVDPFDVRAFAAASAVLAAVAFVANWVPARRAASVSPTTSLRQE